MLYRQNTVSTYTFFGLLRVLQQLQSDRSHDEIKPYHPIRLIQILSSVSVK